MEIWQWISWGCTMASTIACSIACTIISVTAKTHAARMAAKTFNIMYSAAMLILMFGIIYA